MRLPPHLMGLGCVDDGSTDTIDVMVERECSSILRFFCSLIYGAEKRWEDAYQFLITSHISPCPGIRIYSSIVLFAFYLTSCQPRK